MKKQALLSAIVVLILGSIGCGEDGGSSGTGQIRFLCDLPERAEPPGCEIVSPENLRQTVPRGEERIFGSIPHGTSTRIEIRYSLAPAGGFAGGPGSDNVTVDVCAGQTTFVAMPRFGVASCPVS